MAGAQQALSAIRAGIAARKPLERLKLQARRLPELEQGHGQVQPQDPGQLGDG